ncbi:MAG: UDP-N-acetylmuramate--L-alanine ligase [Minwuia sp.]|uniref:UDP-N-acetylmuramate--L-alanine ligase n=1 Tax=Minwuia sp. TaxID=2493630 RepID=UPI003A89256B
MRQMPLDIGPIHFVGIGGIGMSGIAEVMHNLGYRVQGSDIAASANVERLRALGIHVEIGHRAENIDEARVLVTSTAVKGDNPEVRAARQRLVPVVRRAEMLAELMRLKWAIAVGGTHGKTTTTSMVAQILDHAGIDPTVINGGIINAYGTNARLGEGDWMVVEADESDGSFIKLPATAAIVTNMDPEHLDFYGGFDEIRDAFITFVENLPFYGVAIMCIDHPEVQSLIGQVTDRRVISYGFSRQADVRGLDVAFDAGVATFSVEFHDRRTGEVSRLDNMTLPMPGRHNVQNSLAAIAMAREIGIADDTIREGLAGFSGVKRRFTRTGVAGGITVIDDYGHHPVEIEAVLAAAREATKGRVIAVVQPHRYSRLAALFNEFCACFNNADAVIVAEVHAAGEDPIEGVNRFSLVEGLQAHGHRSAVALDGPDQLAATVLEHAGDGDMVVCLGAGSITQWANALPDAIETVLSKKRKGA